VLGKSVNGGMQYCNDGISMAVPHRRNVSFFHRFIKNSGPLWGFRICFWEAQRAQRKARLVFREKMGEVLIMGPVKSGGIYPIPYDSVFFSVSSVSSVSSVVKKED
jgi:hypothetical protein